MCHVLVCNACGLALLAALGCAGSDDLRKEVDVLKERESTLSERLDGMGRDTKKVENRLTAANNAAAQDQKQKLEQIGLTVSRTGKEIAELRQEFGRVLDENARAQQGVVKEQEKAIGALKEELAHTVAQLTGRIDALAEELKKAAAANVSATPAVREGAEL
jgi:chromosome segregation ATPase